jgi:hypothetical protein
MAQIAAVQGVSGTKNNGGVSINTGSSVVLSNVKLGSLDVPTTSIVVDDENTQKALTSGVFAYNNSKPVSKRLTVALSTVANTTLLSGALVPSQILAVNKIQAVNTNKFTTAIRAGYFNIYNGKFVDTNTGEAYTVPFATDTFATDNAANPTRDVPGSLVYGIGSKVPVSANYSKKTV